MLKYIKSLVKRSALLCRCSESDVAASNHPDEIKGRNANQLASRTLLRRKKSTSAESDSTFLNCSVPGSWDISPANTTVDQTFDTMSDGFEECIEFSFDSHTSKQPSSERTGSSASAIWNSKTSSNTSWRKLQGDDAATQQRQSSSSSSSLQPQPQNSNNTSFVNFSDAPASSSNGDLGNFASFEENAAQFQQEYTPPLDEILSHRRNDTQVNMACDISGITNTSSEKPPARPAQPHMDYLLERGIQNGTMPPQLLSMSKRLLENPTAVGLSSPIRNERKAPAVGRMKSSHLILIEPSRKIFEIVHVPYDPESFTLENVLAQIRSKATDPRLALQKYTGIAVNGLHVQAESVPIEVLLESHPDYRWKPIVAVPEGYDVQQIEAFLKELLRIPRVKRFFNPPEESGQQDESKQQS